MAANGLLSVTKQLEQLALSNRGSRTWSVGQNGDIIFAKAFLKASGEALRSDETASAWAPKGSDLQIQIAITLNSGVPTFRKKQFFCSSERRKCGAFWDSL
jgi:hypothetical protein